LSGQTRGPEGRLVAVDEVRHIAPCEPVTEADIDAASVPWSPGLREYEAHTWDEIVVGVTRPTEQGLVRRACGGCGQPFDGAPDAAGARCQRCNP
jgi:hypothetical protein